MTRTYFVTFDVTANVTFEVEAHDEVEAHSTKARTHKK